MHEAGEFLIEFGEQLRDGDELRIPTDEWELPFAFGEPVDPRSTTTGSASPNGIAFQLPGRTDEKAPDVA